MEFTTAASAPGHTWRGITITELTPPDASWQASLVEVGVPAGIRHPVARSTVSETFYYCLEGALEFRIGDARIKARAGDLVAIERGEWFSYQNDSGQPARLLSFNVPPYQASGTQIQEPAVTGDAAGQSAAAPDAARRGKAAPDAAAEGAGHD